MSGGQEVAVQAGRAQGPRRQGEAVSGGPLRDQRSLELLREELLPVLQVGRVHLQEGRTARVPRLQHAALRGAERQGVSHLHRHNTRSKLDLQVQNQNLQSDQT